MTRYWVQFRFHHTGREVYRDFDTLLDRALAIILVASVADVVAMGEHDVVAAANRGATAARRSTASFLGRATSWSSPKALSHMML